MFIDKFKNYNNDSLNHISNCLIWVINSFFYSSLLLYTPSFFLLEPAPASMLIYSGYDISECNLLLTVYLVYDFLSLYTLLCSFIKNMPVPGFSIKLTSNPYLR